MTFNEKLKQALAENHNERVSRSTVIEENHRFSLSYRIWERKTLRDLRRNRFDSRWTVRRVRRDLILVAVTAVVVFMLTAFTVVGITTGRFSFEDKRDYSKLFIKNISSDKTRIEEYYGLPEKDGWMRDDFYADDFGTMIRYIRNDKIVTFRQEIIHGNMGNVNTENAVVEPMSLYKENDGFFIAMNGGDCCALFWIYDGYLLSLTGNLDKSDLLNLAYSTKIQNF